MLETASPFHPIVKIEGPPGSGKSRELAREAVRLAAQEGIAPNRMLMLAISAPNRKRLKTYLKLEAKQAGLDEALVQDFRTQMLDEWLLDLLNQGMPEVKHWQLLEPVEIHLLLSQLLNRQVPAGHPLYHASRQASFAQAMADCIRQLELAGVAPEECKQSIENHDLDERLALLVALYENYYLETRSARLISYSALPKLALERLKAQDNIAFNQYDFLLSDEAQELSAVQQQILKALPVRLILAGNERLSIRSYRGAQPAWFKGLAAEKPVTNVVRQACMRGNEAILSLLNGFLPEPVWEEQTPNREQLNGLVKFGLYQDPEQEALALADLVSEFVATAQVGEHPARWEDCVILVRSAHYRAHLTQAFTLRNIPFQQDTLSEAAQLFQHGFYDLLQILVGWQTLGFQAKDFEDPAQLKARLNQSPVLLPDKLAICEVNNRYLTRWLERCLHVRQETSDIQHIKQAQPGESPLLLVTWLDPESTPPGVLSVLEQLISLYTDWLAYAAIEPLLQGAFAEISPELAPMENGATDETPMQADWLAFQRSLAQLATRYYRIFDHTLRLADLLNHYEALWQGVSFSNRKPGTGVKLLSIHQVQGEEYPWVAIPFMVSEEFPYRRALSEVLSPEAQAQIGLTVAASSLEAEEARLLAVGMTRATQQLVLTCHTTEGPETVLPSRFYTDLLAQKRRLLGQESIHAICWCENGELKPEPVCKLDYCGKFSQSSGGLIGSEADVMTESPFDRFTGDSAWANLSPQQAEPLYEPHEVLMMSPSAINTYMRCPRQFYYKQVLRLPEPDSQAASLGTLVHKVMEVFNEQAQPGQYTMVRLKAFAEALFDFEEQPENFANAGYGEREFRELSHMSELARSALKNQLLASIEDLADKGYFERYGTLRAVHAEKAIQDVILPGITRCLFRGKMDVVIQLADGRWEVVDYKTYGPGKYKAKWDACEEKFQKTLEPLPDQEGLSHQERFHGKMNASYPVDYQLPLYFMACEQIPEYQGRLEGIALQLVRPQFPDNSAQGAIRLTIPAEAIERYKTAIMQDIERFVINPILESQRFEAEPASGACDYCAYASICEKETAQREEPEA